MEKCDKISLFRDWLGFFGCCVLLADQLGGSGRGDSHLARRLGLEGDVVSENNGRELEPSDDDLVKD